MAGEQDYSLGLSLTQLRKDIAQAKSEFRSIGDSSVTESKRMMEAFNSVGTTISRTITGALSVKAIASFGRQVVSVRGDMQLLEQSFDVLTGSAEKSKEMLSDIIALATDSPLEMTPVAKAAQTLMGFGTASEDVMGILRQLSDVSMGNQQRFESLSLVYAQTQAAGKLMGQDLLQYINAGFNPLSIIAEQTGKSVAVLKEEMSNGAISAQMVADAFTAATSEGGKFYQMTQKQAAGIVGVKATFEDSITQMFNNIGKQSEDTIKSGYEMATSLVQNYETIGKALGVLIATYGTYKAAVITVTTIENIRYQATLAQMAGMTKMQAIMDVLRAKTAALNKTMLANPYVLLATVVVAAGTALWTFSNKTDKATDSIKKFREEQEQTKQEVENLLSIIQDETSTNYARVKAYDELAKKAKELTGQYSLQELQLLKTADAQVILNKAQEQQYGEKLRTDYLDALKKVRKYEEELSNPTATAYGSGGSSLAAKQQLKDAKKNLEIIAKEYSEYIQLQQSASEINSKKDDPNNTVTTTYGEEYRAAQKEWEEAKKAYEAIEKDKDSVTAKVYNNAKEELEKTKKAFQNLGGDTSEKKISNGDKDLIEGSIGWYEAQITKLQEIRKTLTDASEIGEIDKNIRNTQMLIDLLNDEANIEGIEAEGNKITAEYSKDNQDYLNTLYEQYATYEQRKEAIRKEYEEKRLALQADGASQDIIDNLNSSEAEDIKVVDNEAFDSLKVDANIITQIFDDTAKRTTKQINALRTQTQELLSYLTNTSDADIEDGFGMTAEQLKTLKSSLTPDQLNAINKALDELYDKSAAQNPFAQLATDAKSLFSDGGFNISNMQSFSSSLSSVTNMVTGVTGALSDMFEASGNEKGAEIVAGIEQGLTSVSNIASGFASGGIIGGAMAAVTELINGFTAAAQAEAEHQAKLEEIREAAIAQQEEYNDLLREQNLLYEEGNNLLATDSYGTATNAIAQAKEDLASLNEDIAALSEVEIATGSYTKGTWFWKKQYTTYTDLLDLYPDLIDANGQLDAEMAQAILDTREMSEEHEELLQNAIDSYEDFQESLAVMTDYISELFGGMGDSLMDSLIEAFEAGESAAEDFLDSVSSMLEDFVSDMIYSLAFAEYFNKASEEIAAIQTGYDADGTANEYADMTDEEKLEAQMGVLADLYKNVDSNMDYANSLLENAKALGEEYGYNLFDSDDDRTSTSSSGITASQESVDSVDGRLTVMQGHTYTIAEKVTTIAQYLEDFALSALYSSSTTTTDSVTTSGDSSGVLSEICSIGIDIQQLRENSSSILETVTGIKQDTGRLEAIEGYIGDVKTSLGTIETKGVKLRT